MIKFKYLLAHYEKDNPKKKQLLVEHLLNVGSRSRELGREVGLGNSSQLIGLLHDFGKYRDEFQSYIRGEYKGRVNHSSAGAIILDYISEVVFGEYCIKELLDESSIKLSTWNLYKEILQYPILSYHGLYDIIDNDKEYRTGKRLLDDTGGKDNIGSKDKEFLDIINSVNLELNSTTVFELYYEGFKEFIKVLNKIKAIGSRANGKQTKDTRTMRAKTLHFYYGALVRLLLSILKEADIYDSSNYYREDRDKTYVQDEVNDIWLSMEESVENLYRGFRDKGSKSELNTVRTELADEIHLFSKEYGSGTYKLDMPVWERVIIVTECNKCISIKVFRNFYQI